MNYLKKDRIKNNLRYSWPLYIFIPAIIGLLMNFIFSVVHKLPAYKTLTIFVSGEVKDSKGLKNDLLTKYEDKELKSVTFISALPNEGHYYTKLTVPGYSTADVLIIPESKFDTVDVPYFALDLSNELIESYYSGYSTYDKNGVSYGIKLNKELVSSYMNLPNEDCYLFLNGGSQNLGEYSNKPVKEHDLALQLVKYWGM